MKPHRCLIPAITICFLLAICVADDSFQTRSNADSNGSAQEEETWHEAQWVNYLATQQTKAGSDTRVEHRLPDGSRVDIYEESQDRTFSVAWEVDWAPKWKEAVGQSLFYASSLDNQGRRCFPGIWLLCKPGDDEHYLRCLTVVRELRGHGIPVSLRIQDVSQIPKDAK